MKHDYQLLSTQDKSALRTERVRALELDLFRAELAFEDALSEAEKESIIRDMAAIKARLIVHYEVLLPGERKEEDATSGN